MLVVDLKAEAIAKALKKISLEHEMNLQQDYDSQYKYTPLAMAPLKRKALKKISLEYEMNL